MKKSPVILSALCVIASGCTALEEQFPGLAMARAAEGPRPEATLYARDGSPVDGAQSKAVPERELAPSENGRTYILELYQQAIDERDQLRREVDVLNAQASIVATQAAQHETDLAAQRARITALEAESQRRLDENIDLAARLVTAQIRRLQAEKVLLEARLAATPAVTQVAEHK